MEILITERLAILGHPQRLAVFRLLMRRYPDTVPASEVAAALDLKANTFSAYVNALMKVGLVQQERVGRSLRYCIDLDAARTTLDYLLFECCRGRPEICAPVTRPSVEVPGVLFVCTGNSARSIMAEAILREKGNGRFGVYSAGTAPRPHIHPVALQILREKGYDTSRLVPTSLGAFQTPDSPRFDYVITLCDRAANEDCPAWPGHPLSTHWGLPDPASAAEADQPAAFRSTYDALAWRLAEFLKLPHQGQDHLALQRELDGLAKLDTGDT